MDLAQARHNLATAPDERAARQVLIAAGIEALGLDAATRPALADLIRAAATAPRTEARRAFAVLLVQALGVEGLVAGAKSGGLDRDICAFAESALPGVLRRAGYPFGAETYERRRALDRLHARLDELLEPWEPTFPPGVQGLYAG
jgi:hypothetical protein